MIKRCNSITFLKWAFLIVFLYFRHLHEILGQFQPNLHKAPLGNGYSKLWKIKDHAFFKGVIEICWEFFKNRHLVNRLARRADTCVESSSRSVNFKFWKSWPRGVGWGYNGGINFFYIFNLISSIQNLISQESLILCGSIHWCYRFKFVKITTPRGRMAYQFWVNFYIGIYK